MMDTPGGVVARLLKQATFAVHATLLDAICSRAHILRRSRPAAALSVERKLDVLHVISSFDLGGTQQQLMGILTNRGSGKFRHSTTEIFPERNIFYRQGKKIDLERYSKGLLMSGMRKKIMESIRTRSLQCVQIYKMAKDFQALRPDIVVGWGHETAMLTFVAAAIARVPGIFFSIRTLNPSYGGSSHRDLLRRAHTRMVSLVDGVIVNSSFLRRDYARWAGLGEDAISVCLNGVTAAEDDLQEAARLRAEVRQRYGIPHNGVVILNVGRFSEEKGQVLLVQAFGDLVERHRGRELYCMLCGDGPTMEEVQQYAGERGLQRVIFTGSVHDIRPFLHGADIFVMPSYYEGMPNALMEAMAAGLPAVTTNRTGALDVARDGKEVLYVDVAAVDQIVEKLSLLIEQPGERKGLGQRARHRIREFSTERMVETFEGVLAGCRLSEGERS